jgi:hypothetical protein
MNRDWVLFHLAEAADALRQAIEEIKESPDYGDPEFTADMQHIYHHINTAWNSRNANPSDVEPGSDALFNAWGKLPVDLEMMEL